MKSVSSQLVNSKPTLEKFQLFVRGYVKNKIIVKKKRAERNRKNSKRMCENSNCSIRFQNRQKQFVKKKYKGIKKHLGGSW